MKPSERIIDVSQGCKNVDVLIGRSLGVIGKVLDEHAEAIERLKSVIKNAELLSAVATINKDIVDNMNNKPKSLTLEEIEAVLNELHFSESFLLFIKQAFRDKLK